jgi:hypothetical protein
LAKPQLTFSPGVAGWLHEGAHTVYWLVHPFRPVLAAGLARGGSSASCLAYLAAVTPDWNHCARGVCVNSGDIIFASAGVGWEKSLGRSNYGNSKRRKRLGDILRALRINGRNFGCCNPFTSHVVLHKFVWQGVDLLFHCQRNSAAFGCGLNSLREDSGLSEWAIFYFRSENNPKGICLLL